MLSKMLTLAEEQKGELLAGTLVQGLKALHQVALDGGSWSNAVLPLPYDDPLTRDLWAGDELEMQTAVKFTRSVKDLCLRIHAQGRHEDGDGEHEAPTGQEAEGGKGKGRAARKAAAVARKAAGEAEEKR